MIKDNLKLRWPLDAQVMPELRAIVLRCPFGLCDPLALNINLRNLLAALDGTRSLNSLLELSGQLGVTPAELYEVLNLLDQHYFLDSSRFRQFKASIEYAFTTAPVRKAALAGRAYSDNPDLLRQELQRYFPSTIKSEAVLGIVAPHIDYARGGFSYGKAYSVLASDQHDVLLVLGTAHQYGERLFILTEKDFATPLGLVSNARAATRTLALTFGLERSFGEELRHRTEHSLELQLPFLKLQKVEAGIIPILVGSFHTALQRSVYPDELGEYQDFLGALVETISSLTKAGERVGLVAGVDMAHVGAQFGDSFRLTPDILQNIAKRDQEYLNHFVNRERAALHDHIAQDGDARRICGYPTLYTLMHLCESMGWQYRAEVLDYQQAVDRELSCCVTFASLMLKC